MYNLLHKSFSYGYRHFLISCRDDALQNVSRACDVIMNLSLASKRDI